jgi:hypothetical protein
MEALIPRDRYAHTSQLDYDGISIGLTLCKKWEDLSAPCT